MYTFIIQCVYVGSQRKSWPKRTEAKVTNEHTNEQTKERTHRMPFLNLYIDYVRTDETDILNLNTTPIPLQSAADCGAASRKAYNQDSLSLSRVLSVRELVIRKIFYGVHAI